MIALVRIVPMILWTGIMVYGVSRLGPREASEPAVVKAATRLPQNTLLRGDIQQPGFTGRYIVAPAGIDPGKEIKPIDVGDTPIPLLTSTPKWLMVIPLAQASALDGISVGATSRLCGGSADPLASVTIQYLRCASAGSQCSATVDVPIDAMTIGTMIKGLQVKDDLGKLHIAPSCVP